MKLQTMRDAYYGATSTLSELVRNISFAGIASVWILRGEASETIKQLPVDLVLPLLLFLATLLVDFLQYVYRSIAWGALSRRRERGVANKDGETEVADPPAWINWPNNGLIVVKCLFLACASHSLGTAAFQRLLTP